MRGFDLACGNQQVVVGHDANQFTCGHVIGLKAQWVDHDLKHLITLACKPGLQHRINAFDAVLKVLCHAQQRAFGHLARQVDDKDGEFGKIDFVDGILVSACRKLGLGVVHGRPDISDNLGLIPAEFKLKRHACIVLGGRCGHGFQSVQIGQFGLHRFDQQGFAIFGGNTGEWNRDKDRRDFNVRFALFGQSDIGHAARQQ